MGSLGFGPLYLAGGRWLLAAEFSAVIVTKSGGEAKAEQRSYIKGDKIRREFVNPGGTTVFIV